MEQRYEELGLGPALLRRGDYAQACSELALILQRGYGYAPKRLQTALFNDVLVAIRFLPELEASQQLSAVTKVVQAAENVLPRQRKLQVLSEFKHAAVMQRRRSKSTEGEQVCREFSRDILIHIFGLLDARSLARAAAVCRSWSIAANDELLWKDIFEFNFRDLTSGKLIGNNQGLPACILVGKAINDQAVNWKELFKDAVKRHPLRWFSSNRALCRKCDTFVWLEGTCKGAPVCSVSRSQHHKLKPLVPIQVLQFLLKDNLTSSSSSSSDSDSDDNSRKGTRTRVSKLWLFPKINPQPNRGKHMTSSSSLSSDSDSDDYFQATRTRGSKLWAFPYLHSQPNLEFQEVTQFAAMVEKVTHLQLN